MQIITDKQFMRKPCRETNWDEVKQLRLYEQLIASIDSGYRQGIGLAANQIGFQLQFAVYLHNRIDKKSTKWPISIMNPVIVSARDLLPFMQEGCLSMPHRHFSTWRYSRLSYTSIDSDGNRTLKKVEGFEAVVVAHEIDHLNGILCCDRVQKPQEPGRNDPCHCGSGKKFKKCHQGKEDQEDEP